MSFRLAIGLCTIIVGVLSLALCQPPTPRIVRGEASSNTVYISSDAKAKTVLSAFNPAEQVIQIRDLDGLLTNFSTRDR